MKASNFETMLDTIEQLDASTRARVLENCLRNIASQAERAGDVSFDEILATIEAATYF